MVDVVDNDLLNLKPFECVGIFKFDTNIELYKNQLFDFECDLDEFGNRLYKKHDESLMISVSNKTNQINHIFCYKSLSFFGKNLIGLSFADFQNVVEAEYIGEPDILDFEADGLPQTVYEFESLGLQVWVKDNHVVTIIVNNQDSYSDEPFED